MAEFLCRGCGTQTEGQATRSFCSNACQMAARQRALVEQWLETGVALAHSHARHYIRAHVRKEQQARCALCGSAEEWRGQPLVLVLDHIDGDAGNNHRANLRLVCPNCDSQLPTYKNRNNGRGRHARRERYANGQSF